MDSERHGAYTGTNTCEPKEPTAQELFEEPLVRNSLLLMTFP